MIIRENHPKFKIIDEQCFRSKNLYNEANYVIRQEFIENGNYISYYDMNKEFKTHENYKLTFSQPANCTLRLLDKNWKSYFKAIKDWKEHPEKYLGMPKLPKYLKKDGRFPWMIPNNQLYYDYEKSTIYIRNRLMNDYEWKCRCLGRPIQVRFIPRGSCYVMEIVYETEIPDTNGESKNIAAIDLGVDNLVTMTNNIGLNPIIINGKGIKSINQYYNKKKSALQSELMKVNKHHWSKRLQKLTDDRYKKIKYQMHCISKRVVDYCVMYGIDTLIVGRNKGWKQENGGKQNFTYIPYEMFENMLQYKCENNGIKCILTNESYTSGTSFLDNEQPCKENYDKSRRVHRGLFVSNNGTKINADVNGAYQILKKVIPNAFADGIEGVGLHPTVIQMGNREWVKTQ